MIPQGRAGGSRRERKGEGGVYESEGSTQISGMGDCGGERTKICRTCHSHSKLLRVTLYSER